jgi:hypothetical protein
MTTRPTYTELNRVFNTLSTVFESASLHPPSTSSSHKPSPSDAFHQQDPHAIRLLELISSGKSSLISSYITKNKLEPADLDGMRPRLLHAAVKVRSLCSFVYSNSPTLSFFFYSNQLSLSFSYSNSTLFTVFQNPKKNTDVQAVAYPQVLQTLLETGGMDPSNRNDEGRTAYALCEDAELRKVFRREAAVRLVFFVLFFFSSFVLIVRISFFFVNLETTAGL